MKIAPLNAVMQYNIATKKVNFGNNNNKTINTPISQPQQIKPTLQQLQAHSGISFAGTKEDLTDFLKEADRLTGYAETFSGNIEVEQIKRTFLSNPEDLKTILLDSENGIIVLKRATGEQIAAFAEILGDEAPEVFEKILPKQGKDGQTAIFRAGVAKINALAAALGDSAPETFAQILPMQDKEGYTAIFGMHADTIKALGNIFGKDKDTIFDTLLSACDPYGNLPIHPLHCDSEKLEALMEVAPDSLKKALLKELPYGDPFRGRGRRMTTYHAYWRNNLG